MHVKSVLIERHLSKKLRRQTISFYFRSRSLAHFKTSGLFKVSLEPSMVFVALLTTFIFVCFLGHLHGDPSL